MKTTSRLTVLQLSLLAAAVLLVSCGGGDGNTSAQDTGAGQDVTTSDSQSDLAEDLAEQDSADPDMIDPDTGKPETVVPPKQCEPGCTFSDGEYCDLEALECVPITCDYCLKDKDCGTGLTCLSAKQANNVWVNFCTSDCMDDDDCPEGFSCSGDPAMCMPKASCPIDDCGDGQMGDPCAHDGGANASCGGCDDGLKCLGMNPTPQFVCDSDQDCVKEGLAPVENPDCVSGKCGNSYCVGNCDSGECPEGFMAYSPSFGKCYCVPVEFGAGEAGDPCPVFNVHFEEDACGPDLSCLGIAANPDPDDPDFGTCDTVADCDPSDWFLNPDCVEGYCGTSFCSPQCEENDECEDGFYPMDVGGTCFCAPHEVGDADAGDPCPIFGMNSDADACQAEFVCLGISPDESSVSCNENTDCAPNSYPGGQICEDGHCGSSFCAPKCTQKEEDGELIDECIEGFEPISVGESCYCIPMYIGDAEAGDPCPLGNINGSSDECVEDLMCLGDHASESSVVCDKAADCPDSYAGTTACFNGKCGSSACSAECDEMGDCSAGFVPWLLGGGFCYCIPGDAGNVAAGEACAFFNVHTDQGACDADLACFGFGASADVAGDECTEDGDCDLGDYPGNPYCLNGYCVTSFCAPKCDENYDCPPGYNTIDIPDNPCYCQPVQTGDSAAGEACPFGMVNDDADFCMAEYSCLGIPANETVPCEVDGDCAYQPYVGNPLCLDGWCGTSFCAPKCDENKECGEGWEVLEIGDEGKEKCYCQMSYTGMAETDDPCPLYNVNSNAEYCLLGLECLGSPASEGAEECVLDTDCPPDLFIGDPMCFLGYCGSSVCVPPCATGGVCESGGPWLFGESGCFCMSDLAEGDGVMGDACPWFNVNADASVCGAGLACTGYGAFSGGDECTEAADCPNDYTGVVDCVSGTCGSSYCAAPCDESGECTVGYEAITADETDECWCTVPAPEEE